MSLNNQLYELKSVEEALKVIESHRKMEDILSKDSNDVARYNIWTRLKNVLLEIKKDLE